VDLTAAAVRSVQDMTVPRGLQIRQAAILDPYILVVRTPCLPPPSVIAALTRVRQLLSDDTVQLYVADADEMTLNVADAPGMRVRAWPPAAAGSSSRCCAGAVGRQCSHAVPRPAARPGGPHGRRPAC
jgi:hypothetical protein